MYGFETPKEKMDYWMEESELVIDAFRRTGRVPVAVLEAHDQALYLASRATAPGVEPDNIFGASTSGFREAAERGRSLGGNT